MAPVEEPRYDMTGHVDGMCRWIDKDTVLMNDFSLNRRLGERVFWRLIV
jgi:hypothetical protein